MAYRNRHFMRWARCRSVIDPAKKAVRRGDRFVFDVGNPAFGHYDIFQQVRPSRYCSRSNRSIYLCRDTHGHTDYIDLKEGDCAAYKSKFAAEGSN